MNEGDNLRPKRTQVHPERWLAEYGDAMYRYAFARLRNHMSAEDAVQESLLAALAAREHLRAEAAERSWLFGILKHKIVDQFRRSTREVPIGDDEDTDSVLDETFDGTGSWRMKLNNWQSPEAEIEHAEFWAMLHKCLQALPETLAAAIQLVEVDGLDSQETSKALGITTTNLWVRLHRGRLRLRDCIERHWTIKEKSRT